MVFFGGTKYRRIRVSYREALFVPNTQSMFGNVGLVKGFLNLGLT